ncbi:MAG: 1-deoxy-D-xylulose-5-phosphate reductoisomerase [Alphaproteobacteria bacterium]|nr:1-deoxy-D-xylulose-5-phosphate reductoisomerase [Alphaproteobacteria bacterium]
MAVVMPEAVPGRRSVTILGATGSVGCNTIDLIRRNPSDFRVEALTGGRNAALLAEQALLLRPRFVAIADPEAYGVLKKALTGSGIEVAAGPEAIVAAAERPADWVMASIVGAAGLAPTLAAVRRGGIVALANKESLVCAGELVMREVARSGATLLPVDSEHNAIYQVFDFERRDAIEELLLTASGGPFREWTRDAMASVTPKQAVAHPNWDMGAKISIDSATMMNKGLELIEAYHLFTMPEDRISVLVHPQSVIHSMVRYRDGSVLAQLGQPDMRTPIAYTLAWPDRMDAPVGRLDLGALGNLDFAEPDMERFPALSLARDALRAGGTAPTVLNAANEVAVAGFLAGRIGFLDIAGVVDHIVTEMSHGAADSLDVVLAADAEARARADEFIAVKST